MDLVMKGDRILAPESEKPTWENVMLKLRLPCRSLSEHSVELVALKCTSK